MAVESPKAVSSRSRPAWLAPLLAVLGALVVVVVFVMLPWRKEQPATPPEPVVNVAVREVVPVAELADSFEIKGILAPWATINLSAETAGRIQAIAAGEGQRVPPNMPLIHLERDLLEATFNQARATAEFDTRDLERVSLASQRGVASPMELDMATSNAAASRAAMEYAEAQLRRTVIHTPGATPNGDGDDLGVLNDVPVEVGEYVSAGTLVAQIVDDDPLKVLVDVPERDIRYLSVGEPVDVVIEALGNRAAQGAIRFIPVTADPATRTFRVEIRLPNPRRDIRPGMIATVRLLRQVLTNAIMIPLDAVIPLEDGYEVYVVNNERAHRREVSLGLIRGRQVQVLPPRDGGAPALQPGERLIIEGQRLVGEGQKVSVQPTAEALHRAATAPGTGPTTAPATAPIESAAPSATAPAGGES